MPPRKSTAGATAPTRSTKRNSGLGQPTLSFSQQRKPSAHASSKLSKAKAEPINLDATPTSSIEIQSEPAEIYLTDTKTKSKTGKDLGRSGSSLASASANANASTIFQEKEMGKLAPSRVRKELDVKSKEWAGVYREAQAAMGGLMPIHAGPDTHNQVHHVLRVFDLTSKFGPCAGVTRLQRWERAKKWGLNPPEEIHSILTTKQGEDDVTYRENILYGRV